MLKVIFSIRLVLLLGIGLLSCLFVTEAQDNDKPFMRLATYWDAPGQVNAISADDRWIVIYDRNTDTSRLVEVATGKVRATGARERSIRFSPKGRFATVYKRDKQTLQILELDTNRLVAEVESSTPAFSADESLVMIVYYNETVTEWFTKIIETKTGNIRPEIQGRGYNFSPDASLMTVTDTLNKIAKVIETKAAKIVFEFPLRGYSEGQIWDFTFRFSPNGQLLRINQLHDGMTYVIDTTTWQILYNVYGFVTFSVDSRYARVREHDGDAAPNSLLDAKTGKVLDKVYGDMWFSDDGQLLYRMDSTNCQYRGAVRVVRLNTMKALVDIQGCVVVEMLADNNVVHISRGNIDVPQVQQLIEVATGKVIWQEQVPNIQVIDYEGQIALFTRMWQQTIENFKTGEVFASDIEINLSWGKQFAFASNGLLVDLYGAPDLKVDTMPAPRIGGGIVQAAKGKINVYPMPNDAHPIMEEDNNPFNFSVIGKSADEQWLYVVYTIYGHEIIRKQGWIANQNLTMIEDWHDVPVLDAGDPLGSLREVSEQDGA